MSGNNIALYIRLSLADKETGITKNESNSITGQRIFLNNYLDNYDDFKYYNRIEYIDDGYSGTNDNRPMFQKMIEDVKKGNIIAIFVRDSSRLFRSYTDAGNYIECVFPFLGVRFISVNDNYDSDNYKEGVGSLELVIRNIVYASYSRDLSIKTKTAKHHLIKKGKYVGSTPPYGYIMHPTEKHKLVIDPVAYKVVRRIFDYAIDGVKPSKIATILNNENIDNPSKYLSSVYPENKKYKKESIKWRYNTIHKILKNEYYIGTMVCLKYGKENIYSKNMPKEPIKILKNHEPIVSQYEFEKANGVIKKLSDYEKENKKNIIRKSNLNNDNILKGLVYCGNCGKIMHRIKSCDKFHCAYPKEDNCYFESSNKRIHISETVLRENVLQEIENNKPEIKEFKNEIHINNNNKSKFNKDLNTLNNNKIRLYEKYINGQFTKEVYLKNRKSIDENIEKVNNNIKENTLLVNTTTEKSQLLTYDIVHKYIKKIYINNKGVVEIIMKKKE